MTNTAAPIEADRGTVLRRLESFALELGEFPAEAGSVLVQSVLDDVTEAWNQLPPTTKTAPAWDFSGRYLHVIMLLAKQHGSPANRSDARELVRYILWALTARSE